MRRDGKEKRERLIAELDTIMVGLFQASMALAGQRIALDEGKPLESIRSALNDCVEEHKQYCGAEVRRAVKIIEPEPKLQRAKLPPRVLPTTPPKVVQFRPGL